MGRVVHFEIPVDDPERAVRFYRELFGWQIEDANVGMPYWLITTGQDPEPGIDGAIMERGGTANTVVNTIAVESVDDTLERVKQLGGSAVTDVMPIPSVGRFAYCKDLDGNLFGVLQPEPPQA
ncbi:MAG TPA: VOC family protein [Micromonosporaceae bacterium]